MHVMYQYLVSHLSAACERETRHTPPPDRRPGRRPGLLRRRLPRPRATGGQGNHRGEERKMIS